MSNERWPELPYEAWKETYTTLHLWLQVIGKVALAHAPPLNHSWGIAFRLTPRGFSTGTLRHGERAFTIEIDFLDHQVQIATSDGARRTIVLEPRTVAEFYALVMRTFEELSLPLKIWPVAVELPTPIRLDTDVEHATYDREYVTRCWRILTQVEQVLTGTRCSFVGKCSPAHFFWGAFDLAVTRFSGRPAPPREGPAFMREAYSHEVISHGFWPGSGPMLEAAFYAYAVPEPAGFKQAPVLPEAAYYHAELGEFVLGYEAVRRSDSPERAIRQFVETTYAQAADLAGWDRAALERAPVSGGS